MFGQAARLVAAAKARRPGKALPAPGGWVYLVNDTNDFLSWQFGLKRWTPAEARAVRQTLQARLAALPPTPYRMFVTPEKSVVYREWLPEGLDRLRNAADRPALQMAAAAPAAVHYLAPWFERMKRLGFVYFRGDTHVSWLGAYLLYRYVMETIAQTGVATTPPIAYSDLLPELAGFEGDVYAQLDEADRAAFAADAGYAQWRNMLELGLLYRLHPDTARARRVRLADDYLPGFRGRELVAFETGDSTLPRAVVFRDSTATEVMPFLSEHFARVVYAWHDGDVLAEILDRERPDIVLHFVAERFLATYPDMPPINRLQT